MVSLFVYQINSTYNNI